MFLTGKKFIGRKIELTHIYRFLYFLNFFEKNENKTEMSRFGNSVFVRARPLIFSSIDGKSSIFSDGTLLLSKKLLKSAEKKILRGAIQPGKKPKNGKKAGYLGPKRKKVEKRKKAP